MGLMQFISFGQVLPARVRKALRPVWNSLLAWEHQRKEHRFYRQFVKKGDLVFDIGSNVGEKSRALLSLGATVVAVDPNTSCIDSMKESLGGSIASGRLHVECAAVGSAPGEIKLTMIDPLSGMYSGAAEFVRYAAGIGYAGADTASVRCVTLDQLIERYGQPNMIKIDVEGMDADVLKGLHQRPRSLSFEYHTAPGVWNKTKQCFAEAIRIGFRQANLTNATEPSFIF